MLACEEKNSVYFEDNTATTTVLDFEVYFGVHITYIISSINHIIDSFVGSNV